MKNYNCEIDFNANNLQQKISPEGKKSLNQSLANTLLRSLLSASPEMRPTAKQALQHPWFLRCLNS